MPAWAFETGHLDSRFGGRSFGHRGHAPRAGLHGRSEASDLVVAALQDTGLKFGTDGRVPSLWGYLRTTQAVVPPAGTRRGDVLFFQTRGFGGDCDVPDHVAIVAANDGRGRIEFVDAREGQVRRSFVDPDHPQLRRDRDGQIHNTYLRPKKIGDAEDTPTYAGEMVCAAVHLKPR